MVVVGYSNTIKVLIMCNLKKFNILYKYYHTKINL